VKKIILAGVMFALAGCGSAYKSPIVRASDDNTRVRVMQMTGETVMLANNSSYRPQSLPAIFDMTAGGGSVRPAGVLPQPVLSPSVRPNEITSRIPPTPAVAPYPIGVGDVVLLATPRGGSTVEELSGLLAAQNTRQGYTVQDDGSINIPNVGRVQLAGMTIDNAEAELFQRLVENQLDPTFSLEIAEFNSRRVTIGGAVGRPAVAPISLTPLYLDEAIATAGGITVRDQDFSSIRIYRDGALYEIALNDFLTNPDLRQIRLIDGDSVFVDTSYNLNDAQDYFAQQITLNQARQQSRAAALTELNTEVNLRRANLNEARSNFETRASLGAEKRDYVYLTGEVGKQSRFALPYGQRASLADALFDAGNGIPIETGDVSQIYVLRASDDPREFGAVTAWNLDATNAVNFTLAARFELRPNDVVFVAEQAVTRWGRVIRQITPSLITTSVAAAAN
tara:strand:+ start:1974 stop:3329 length:1356 start_codon:yes stop_codon:yes gene_type:complete